MCKINKTQLSCLAPPNRRVGFPHYKSDKGVKMAVAIGAPPEVVLASQAKLNQRTDKYVVASNLQGGSPVKLAKCVTSDLLVPACSEMILECTTVPKSNYNDTPFGEYPGTYSLRSNAFVVTVDAITYRKNFIYQTILTGQVPQEDSNLCAIPYSAEVYRAASNLVEEVTDIAAFIGNNVFDTIVCIKKNSNAEVENLMHLLLGNKIHQIGYDNGPRFAGKSVGLEVCLQHPVSTEPEHYHYEPWTGSEFRPVFPTISNDIENCHGLYGSDWHHTRND
jgi:3-polyprenyl-4-hydroxybenzoate decarboxylase